MSFIIEKKKKKIERSPSRIERANIAKEVLNYSNL